MSRTLPWLHVTLAGFLLVAAHSSMSFATVSNPGWTVESSQAQTQLGWSVSRAGDVNGDGYGDVLIGTPRFTNGSYSEGRVSLYLGSASGLSASAAWNVEGDQIGIELGHSVAGAGDVNGDGYDDILVGAPFANGWRGLARLYYGSATGPSTTPAWTGGCNCTSAAQFGRSVGSAGDVNGDGFDDLIIGAQAYYNGTAEVGAVYIFPGSPTGPPSIASRRLNGPQHSDAFGAAVGSAGDVNGDGFGDVIVGAPEFTNGETDEGGVFVYFGSPGGPGPTPDWMVEGGQAGARLGISASAAGDVNGDGYSDIAAGAYAYDGAALDEGLVVVYHGSAAGLPSAPSWSATGGSQGAWLGQSVAAAGDINGDGFDDLIAGAPARLQNQRTLGAVFFAYGSPTGLSSAPLDLETGQVEGSIFGSSVSSAGDVDGNGTADVVVGAPYYTSDVTNQDYAGKAYLYLGLLSTVDRDGDGFTPLEGDCDDREALRWARPGEAAELRFLDSEALAWDPQTLGDGSTPWFDLIRSAAPGDFLTAASCVESDDSADASAIDAGTPPAGQAWYYLVRAENACAGALGRGPLGVASSGLQRMGRSCP